MHMGNEGKGRVKNDWKLLFSTTKRVELPSTEVGKATDKTGLGLEIYQEFVFGPVFEVPVTYSNGDI